MTTMNIRSTHSLLHMFVLLVVSTTFAGCSGMLTDIDGHEASAVATPQECVLSCASYAAKYPFEKTTTPVAPCIQSCTTDGWSKGRAECVASHGGDEGPNACHLPERYSWPLTTDAGFTAMYADTFGMELYRDDQVHPMPKGIPIWVTVNEVLIDFKRIFRLKAIL